MKFYIEYENENGQILMGTKIPYLISEITGLEQVATDDRTIPYVNRPGLTTAERLPTQRTITISGRVFGSDKLQRRHNTDKLARVFNNLMPSEMRISVWGKMRRISCTSKGITFGKLNPYYLDFMIVLLCDNPYFKDWEDIRVKLFYIENNLFDGMTFPRVFSYMYAGGTVVNNGDADIDPVIIINAGEPGIPIETGIAIRNDTTGQEIILNYSPADGEEITIDVDKSRITSNINGNITRYMDKFINLGDFVLKKGANKISFENYNTQQPLTAQMVYSNNYIEAVY